MDTLILEDFRCFAGRHEVPIRPLTLLVGENSTGKTSFLAGLRAAHDLRSRATVDFNADPFHLGSYDQIANYRGGRAGRAQSFALGQQFTVDADRSRRRRRGGLGAEMRVRASFRSEKAQPLISDFSVSAEEYELRLSASASDEHQMAFLVGSEMIFERVVDEELGRSIGRYSGPGLLFYFAGYSARDEGFLDLDLADRERFDQLFNAIASHVEPRAYAFAPIRTSPRRTYDPTTEVRDPEGSHIPMMLERLLVNGAESDFKERLEEFGRNSGLYSSLSIRKMGRKGSDPFQIEVRPPGGGMARNLIDVGYGVSQAIPIIADCVSAEPGATLLVQQPEVHLHPRAQAAMGSFFRQRASSRRNPVVVETHSDYLVDRIRMDVRDEEIKASDVIILYFEQGRRGVDIHPIELDAAGRVVDVPRGYRSFFLEEQRRFFGVE